MGSDDSPDDDDSSHEADVQPIRTDAIAEATPVALETSSAPAPMQIPAQATHEETAVAQTPAPVTMAVHASTPSPAVLPMAAAESHERPQRGIADEAPQTSITAASPNPVSDHEQVSTTVPSVTVEALESVLDGAGMQLAKTDPAKLAEVQQRIAAEQVSSAPRRGRARPVREQLVAEPLVQVQTANPPEPHQP
jgi:ribonuclease E